MENNFPQRICNINMLNVNIDTCNEHRQNILVYMGRRNSLNNK